MQRAHISSYAQKVGVVLAHRAIIVYKIYDVTLYNASLQSNALNTLDPEFLRMRISKKQSEYCKEIALRVEYSNDIARNILHLAERRKTRTECK